MMDRKIGGLNDLVFPGVIPYRSSAKKVNADFCRVSFARVEIS